jgi:hypothetical protein
MSQNDLPGHHEYLAESFKPEKHHEFSSDFVYRNVEIIKVCDEAVFLGWREIDGVNASTIDMDEVKFFTGGCLDDHPYMTDITLREEE